MPIQINIYFTIGMVHSGLRYNLDLFALADDFANPKQVEKCQIKLFAKCLLRQNESRLSPYRMLALLMFTDIRQRTAHMQTLSAHKICDDNFCCIDKFICHKMVFLRKISQTCGLHNAVSTRARQRE